MVWRLLKSFERKVSQAQVANLHSEVRARVGVTIILSTNLDKDKDYIRCLLPKGW